MTDLVELGRAIAGASAIAGAVKDAEKSGKDSYVAAVTAMGANTFSADVNAHDGTKLAGLVYRKGGERISVEVTDPAALLAWVTRNEPEQLVEVVNPAWLERIVAVAKKTGTTACADTSGAVLPGITVTTGVSDPGIAVTLTADAKARAAELVAGGAFLALTAAPDPADDAALAEAATLAAIEDEDHR
jgi:hypothetical protein